MRVLNQVASAIAQIADSRERSNLMASAGVLAGLVLEKEVIFRILREDLMRESVIYQDIWQGGKQEGIQVGKQEGIQVGRQEGIQVGRQSAMEELARNLLRENMPLEQVVRLTGLSLEVVQSLQG